MVQSPWVAVLGTHEEPEGPLGPGHLAGSVMWAGQISGKLALRVPQARALQEEPDWSWTKAPRPGKWPAQGPCSPSQGLTSEGES